MSQQPSSSFRADCLCSAAVITQHTPELKFEKALCIPSAWNRWSCSRAGRPWDALSHLRTWQSHSSVLGLVSYLCHVITLLFKTILDSLCLPRSHHLGFQTRSELVNLFPIRTSNAPKQPHRYCRFEGAPKPDPFSSLTWRWRWRSRTTPLLHLVPTQGSQGRGNTVALLTCNNHHDTREGSLEMPLHQVWKEQWNFQSSSRFETQQDKGMKNSSWKHKQSLESPRFISLVSLHLHHAKRRPPPPAIPLRDVKPKWILCQ